MDKNLRMLLSDVQGGHRLSDDEARKLFQLHTRDVWDVATAADEMREQTVGNAVTYVRNQNINVTNICVNSCGFCGFSKKPGENGIYFHEREAIQKKAALARSRQVTEICTVSGLHPAFTAQSYIDVYRWIYEAAPG
ncbi:MAG: 7,8-didemethyl-8-hydroxy-5-deazariboflavin synthase subunit CofH, partial [Methanoregula sp.]|nr:7,8-didemethyl-8-hydroxy-5-deazariboflavin synthase subunit CofH [Methanoregula sp.]